MRMIAVAAFAVGFSVWLLSGLQVQSPEERAENAELFQTNCASCHGEDGSGATAVGRQLGVPDFHSADIQSKTDPELLAAIRAVPAHGAFERREGEAGLARVIAHVRTFGEESQSERE